MLMPKKVSSSFRPGPTGGGKAGARGGGVRSSWPAAPPSPRPAGARGGSTSAAPGVSPIPGGVGVGAVAGPGAARGVAG
eukprot:10833944-Alexandrium_andersonii.AAC.1